MVARRRIIRAGCGRSTNNELVWLALQFDMRNRVCNKTCVCVVVAREREMRVVFSRVSVLGVCVRVQCLYVREKSR